MKRFEDSPLGKELKAKTDIGKKIYETDKTINKKPILNNYTKSDLIYENSFSFCKYCDIKRFKTFLSN